jgi:hypothetical protein
LYVHHYVTIFSTSTAFKIGSLVVHGGMKKTPARYTAITATTTTTNLRLSQQGRIYYHRHHDAPIVILPV